MRVKSENGVVFAVETNKRQLFLWVLGFFFLVLCSKVSERDESKKNEKSRLLLSLLSSSDVFGGCQLCTKRGLIKKKFKMCRRVCLFFFTLERRTFCALLCVSANRISNTHAIRILIHT